MPLTNNVIIKLNEITTMIEDKTKFSESEIDEIEFWFENEGNWTKKESRIRLVNISSYIQDKYQQTLHLRIISDDDDDCGCSD
jgi:hypothetical protein